MSAFTTPIVNAAPGNTIQVACSGFAAGAAMISIDSQGATGALVSTYAGTFSSTALQWTIPDGLTEGTVTATDSTSASATFGLRVDSQYLQSSEYFGEGMNVASLATGELDAVLRRASAYVDAYIGAVLRQRQYLERHKWRKSRRIFPYHRPIISVDQLTFVTSNQIKTDFNVGLGTSDIYTNESANYVEILAYALGNYALLGAIETIGFSANVIELTLTAGYPMLRYPQRVREATAIIATELLRRRAISSNEFGQLVKMDTVEFDPTFQIPQPAKTLLDPYANRSIR